MTPPLQIEKDMHRKVFIIVEVDTETSELFIGFNLHWNKQLKKEKIWSVSTRLSEHLLAVRHLNKLETANISIYKQNKSNI